jgi:hypothetical protein
MFDFFKKKKQKIQYQLVEAALDDQHFRQGIRIMSGKYAGLVFTTRPKVELKEVDGQMHLNFQYNIEFMPEKIKIDHQELKSIIGDILLELIEKDYNASGTPDSQYSNQE